MMFDNKAACVYSGHSISKLQQFEELVGRTFDQVVVFSNHRTDWAAWERPWFLNEGNLGADGHWLSWATAPDTHRQLVITLEPFPVSEYANDWLHQAAYGPSVYAGHYTALATNLVNAGLGNSVIRLAHEMNGPWSPYAINTNKGQPYDYDQGQAAGDSPWFYWKLGWCNVARAMSKVPGASFVFDWCIVAGHGPDFEKYYPATPDVQKQLAGYGETRLDWVDIIGIDAYDAVAGGSPDPATHWQQVLAQPYGIQAILDYARSKGKPVSFPEWGLWPGVPYGGDADPLYVQNMGRVFQDNPVAYQSYFFADTDQQATLLSSSSACVSAYKQAVAPFGSRTL